MRSQTVIEEAKIYRYLLAKMESKGLTEKEEGFLGMLKAKYQGINLAEVRDLKKDGSKR